MKSKSFIFLFVAFFAFYSSKSCSKSIGDLDPGLKTIKNGNLDLSNQGLTDLDGLEEISDIEIVKNLNLVNNKISELTEGVFDNLIVLEFLDLPNNEIKNLPEKVFNKLTNLKSLDLQNNNIEKLPEKIFDNLIALELLYLQNNEIKNLPEKVFDELENIGFIFLKGNPFTPEAITIIKDFKSTRPMVKIEYDIPPDLSELNTSLQTLTKELRALEDTLMPKPVTPPPSTGAPTPPPTSTPMPTVAPKPTPLPTPTQKTNAIWVLAFAYANTLEDEVLIPMESLLKKIDSSKNYIIKNYNASFIGQPTSNKALAFHWPYAAGRRRVEIVDGYSKLEGKDVLFIFGYFDEPGYESFSAASDDTIRKEYIDPFKKKVDFVRLAFKIDDARNPNNNNFWTRNKLALEKIKNFLR